MVPALKAEFRKLLTVRSTYFIVLACLLIAMFFAGFVDGFRNDVGSLHAPGLLAEQSTGAVIFAGLILAFAGLLLAGHEYRYSTIMYTLTASNRRYKVLLAKFLVITTFSVVTTAAVTLFSPLCTIVGAHLAGKDLGPQTFDTWSLLWRCIFCGWGYGIYAFILLIALRNQVGAIVTFLLIPMIGESIFGALLKDNARYLPFAAVQSVADPSNSGLHPTPTSAHQAGVVLIYIAVGLLISSILFIRRDAN